MTHEPMATTVLTHNHHDEKNDGKTNSVVANVRWTRTHILRLDGRWLIYVDVTSRFIYLLFFFFAFFSFDAIASVPHSTTTTSTTKPWQIYTHNVNDNQHIRLISSYNACRANCIIWILCSTVFGAHCMSVAHWMRAFVVQKRDRDDSNVVQFKNRWRREIFNVSNANAVQLLLNAFNQFGGSLNSMPSFHRQNYGRTKKNAKLRHREMNKPKKIQKKKKLNGLYVNDENRDCVLLRRKRSQRWFVRISLQFLVDDVYRTDYDRRKSKELRAQFNNSERPSTTTTTTKLNAQTKQAADRFHLEKKQTRSDQRSERDQRNRI